MELESIKLDLTCEEHDQDIQNICVNQSCKNSRLVCCDCLSDHITCLQNQNNPSFIQFKGFNAYLKKICEDDFFSKLKEIIKQVKVGYNKFEKNIKDKYVNLYSSQKFNRLTSGELNEYIQEIAHYDNFKKMIILIIEKHTTGLTDQFEQQTKLLNLKSLKYLQASTEEKRKSNLDLRNGNDWYYQDQYEVALTYLEESLKNNQNNVDTLSTKGHVLRKLGKLKESLKTYETVLISNPEHFNSLMGIGLIYLTNEKYKKSFLYLKKAEQLSIINQQKFENYECLKGLGVCLYYQKKYQDAQTYFELTLNSLNGKKDDTSFKKIYSEIFVFLGYCLYELKRPDDAWNQLLKAIKNNPEIINDWHFQDILAAAYDQATFEKKIL